MDDDFTNEVDKQEDKEGLILDSGEDQCISIPILP